MRFSQVFPVLSKYFRFYLTRLHHVFGQDAETDKRFEQQRTGWKFDGGKRRKFYTDP